MHRDPWSCEETHACPRCNEPAGSQCMDLRCNSSNAWHTMRPHRERIALNPGGRS